MTLTFTDVSNLSRSVNIILSSDIDSIESASSNSKCLWSGGGYSWSKYIAIYLHNPNTNPITALVGFVIHSFFLFTAPYVIKKLDSIWQRNWLFHCHPLRVHCIHQQASGAMTAEDDKSMAISAAKKTSYNPTPLFLVMYFCLVNIFVSCWKLHHWCVKDLRLAIFVAFQQLKEPTFPSWLLLSCAC